MECLHRFCRECIDKSMRLGCRFLRDDPNYDALISALYPDIDKYEEEELDFHADEKFRNNQIQSSIAQTYRRQTEALGKKRTPTRATSTIAGRRQSNHRNLRGRRNHDFEYHESDEEEGANGHDASNDLSSADEHLAEVKSNRCKRTGGARTSQPSLGINADGVCDDNYSEENGEQLAASSTLIGGIEFLAWGRGGIRSNNRHGGLGWACGRIPQNDRLSCLTNHLQHSLASNEMKVSLMLVTLQEEKIPSLKRPYICCSPTSSVTQLCQYVSMQTSVEAGDIEMLMIPDDHPIDKMAVLRDGSAILHPLDSKLHVLNAHQTLEEIHATYTQKNLILAYRLKAQGEGK